MFTIDARNQVRDRVLELAATDARVVAGAVVGSLARGPGDRWSDLDLTFGVADDVPLVEILDEWSERLAEEFDSVRLFDLPSGGAIYRVFLLPGCLQFDLSFAPASQFGAVGSDFTLLFGKAVEKPFAGPPSAEELFGYAIHHAVRARVCIERSRLWQAEYWISGVRDSALSLACLRRGLPARHGRGFDQLPREVADALRDALVQTLDEDELLRALRSSVDGLFREAADVGALATKLQSRIRQLIGPA